MRYRYRSKDELKDSGVEWIGKIPKDWKVGKFKYSSLLYTGNSIKDNEKDNYTDPENSYPYISTKDINIDYNTINYNNGMYTKTNDKTFKIANKDSILICIEGGSAGRKISYLNQNVSFVNKLCCIQSNKIDSKYQYYYCNSDAFKKEFSLNMSGLIGGVSVSALNNFRLVNPSLFEQEKISNFLDEKTSQFDLIISKKEKLIERLEESKKSLISEVVTGKVKVVKTNDGYELVKRSNEEMKDSGVEWLGDIPKDWDVKRIKQISSVISKGTTPSTVGKEIIDNGEIRFLKAENIFEGKISLTPEFFIDEETNNILKRSELKEHDILFVIAGATIGKVAIVQKEHCPANTNQAISFIRLYDDINYKFVYYWLNSSKLQETMWLYAVQSAQPNLSMENLGNFYIAYPSEDEIYILTDYIEDKGIEISNIINNIKKQIEKLKEAKQSLISEAVTGKIEILD